MSIMWKYLDKRSATIAAIKDYDAMQFILSSTGDEIKRTYEKMTGIGSPNYDGMPKACNPQAAEDRIIKNIDEIDIIKERYRQAVEYMDWFKPAWEELTDEERYCLETFYGDNNASCPRWDKISIAGDDILIAWKSVRASEVSGAF